MLTWSEKAMSVAPASSMPARLAWATWLKSIEGSTTSSGKAKRGLSARVGTFTSKGRGAKAYAEARQSAKAATRVFRAISDDESLQQNAKVANSA